MGGGEGGGHKISCIKEDYKSCDNLYDDHRLFGSFKILSLSSLFSVHLILNIHLIPIIKLLIFMFVLFKYFQLLARSQTMMFQNFKISKK